MWPFSKRRGQIEELTQPSMDFVGEQDGPPEDALKDKLRVLFRAHPLVDRAYLCRVNYREVTSQVVALCIAGREDPKLAASVGQVFWEMFSKETSLDIVFIDATMEQRVAAVCRPFYEITQTNI